jgi:hypothetical protein
VRCLALSPLKQRLGFSTECNKENEKRVEMIDSTMAPCLVY